MYKRTKAAASLLLSCTMMFSSGVTIAASADDTAPNQPNTIFFDSSGGWDKDDVIYFSLYDDTAGEYYSPEDGWFYGGTIGSPGTYVGDGITESFEIDLSGREDHDIFVVFLNYTDYEESRYHEDSENLYESYECVLTTDALGHKAYMTGNILDNRKNDVDLNIAELAPEVEFEGVETCGSHKRITTNGVVQGKYLAPSESPAKLVAQYVDDHFYNSLCTKEKISEFINELGTDSDSVWSEYLKLYEDAEYDDSLYVNKKIVIYNLPFDKDADYYNQSTVWFDNIEYTFNIDELTYSVTGKDYPVSDTVTIRSNINGMPVTAICDNVFRQCNIKSVVIPDSVVSIGNYAFDSCFDLSDLTLGKSVTTIGDYAFFLLFS